MEMTPRDRFLAAVNFEPTDRPVCWKTIGFWDETIARWHGEGLPEEVIDEIAMYIHEGFDLQKAFRSPWSASTPTVIARKLSPILCRAV